MLLIYVTSCNIVQVTDPNRKCFYFFVILRKDIMGTKSGHEAVVSFFTEVRRSIKNFFQPDIKRSTDLGKVPQVQADAKFRALTDIRIVNNNDPMVRLLFALYGVQIDKEAFKKSSVAASPSSSSSSSSTFTSPMSSQSLFRR